MYVPFIYCMCLCVCVSLIKFEWSYTSEGVSFKYDRMEYECVSFKSNVTFKVLVEFVRLVESGVLVVSECVVFISYELGVSSMCECVCVCHVCLLMIVMY